MRDLAELERTDREDLAIHSPRDKLGGQVEDVAGDSVTGEAREDD